MGAETDFNVMVGDKTELDIFPSTWPWFRGLSRSRFPFRQRRVLFALPLFSNCSKSASNPIVFACIQHSFDVCRPRFPGKKALSDPGGLVEKTFFYYTQKVLVVRVFDLRDRRKAPGKRADLDVKQSAYRRKSVFNEFLGPRSFRRHIAEHLRLKKGSMLLLPIVHFG